VLVLVALDLSRRPERQFLARGVDALIGRYQTAVSPVLARAGVHCRFELSCSEYTRTAIRARGLAAGGLLGIGRLARCGPWTEAGTADPVAR